MLLIDDVCRILNAAQSDGPYRLIIEILYVSGLRLRECCRLRVKDVDFDRRRIIVCERDKDRAVPLPDSGRERLQRQIEVIRIQNEMHLEQGAGYVWLPYALAKKFPNASREFKWEYVLDASCDFVTPVAETDAFQDPTTVSGMSSTHDAGPCGLLERVNRHSFRTPLVVLACSDNDPSDPWPCISR